MAVMYQDYPTIYTVFFQTALGLRQCFRLHIKRPHPTRLANQLRQQQSIMPVSGRRIQSVAAWF